MTRSSRISNVLAGLAGGLLVAIVALVLIATGAIGTSGDSEGTALTPQPLTQPASDESGGDEGLTVLVVEQNANLALEIGHRGYVLETGQIVASGPSHQLRDDDAIRKAYLGF